MDGERLLLDLVNSRLISGGEVHDELGDDGRAAEWLRDHGAPAEAAQVADARAARAALVAVLRGEASDSVLEPWIRSMTRTARLAADGLEWVDQTPADRRVGSEAIAAWALLQNAGRPRIRPCEAEGCQHFLIDNSRSNNRRWHSMETCGNREKARRHYARAKTAS